MAETVLDSLVVKIAADTRSLETGVQQTTASLKGLESFASRAQDSTLELGGLANYLARDMETAADRASDHMAGAFARLAQNGKLSFDNLRDAALSAVADIAASLLTVGVNTLFTSLFSGSFLPGRAAGGSVSPGQAYVVGERGPELFVPQSSGRVSSATMGALLSQPSTSPRSPSRNITINVQGVRDGEGLRQSSAQIALAVRRALARAERSL